MTEKINEQIIEKFIKKEPRQGRWKKRELLKKVVNRIEQTYKKEFAELIKNKINHYITMYGVKKETIIQSAFIFEMQDILKELENSNHSTLKTDVTTKVKSENECQDFSSRKNETNLLLSNGELQHPDTSSSEICECGLHKENHFDSVGDYFPIVNMCKKFKPKTEVKDD